MGGSKWMKAKMALGLKLNSCLYVPRTVDNSPAAAAARTVPLNARFSDAVSLSPTSPPDSDHRVQMPTTPTPSSSGLRLPKQSSKSGKVKNGNICFINKLDFMCNLKCLFALLFFFFFMHELMSIHYLGSSISGLCHLNHDWVLFFPPLKFCYFLQ